MTEFSDRISEMARNEIPTEEWHKHNGTVQCPVNANTLVQVKWNLPGYEKLITTHKAGKFNWIHVAAWRLMGNGHV